MSEITFMVRGQVMGADGVRATADKAPIRHRPPAEPKHGGFAVMGWPPGYIAEAQEWHENKYRRWLRMDAEEQRDAGHMSPWDEQAWRAKNKQKTLAKRATPGGADALADLARKQGWTEVVVLEVIRGKA